MDGTLRIEIIGAEALEAADVALWHAMIADNPDLASPYFHPEFTRIAAQVSPHAAIAVFRRGNRTIGFFPHQRRGGLIQPIGAPLADYHGVISRTGEPIEPATVAQTLGGALRVGGWVSPAGPVKGFLARNQMAADVSGGSAALFERMEARNHRFFKNTRRLRRGFERDHGVPIFTWEDRDPATLDWIIGHKRKQYLRSRQHDVFACGWTGALLHGLLKARTAGFGLRVASLRTAAGHLVAAEASLDDGRTLHLWFPTYDPAYARYGVGTLLTLLEMEQAAASGYRRVDFGCGEDSYKSVLAEPSGTVFEGVVEGRGPDLARMAGRLMARGPAPLRRFKRSLDHRFDIINACETQTIDWWAGAADAAVAAARKTRRVSS